MKKQKLPKWFKGELYDSGDKVTNPFSGETFTLTGPELSMYDFIIGSQLVFEIFYFQIRLQIYLYILN